jgi:hypothetical protein
VKSAQWSTIDKRQHIQLLPSSDIGVGSAKKEYKSHPQDAIESMNTSNSNLAANMKSAIAGSPAIASAEGWIRSAIENNDLV